MAGPQEIGGKLEVAKTDDEIDVAKYDQMKDVQCREKHNEKKTRKTKIKKMRHCTSLISGAVIHIQYHFRFISSLGGFRKSAAQLHQRLSSSRSRGGELGGVSLRQLRLTGAQYSSQPAPP